MIKFSTATPDEVFSSADSAELFRRYAGECANPAFEGAPPDSERYRSMHEAGLLHVIVAKDESRIVGVGAVVVYPLPHYEGKLSATLDSIYLLPEYRQGAAGLRLIKECLDTAKRNGAIGMYLSAPAGSRLEKLADRIARRTNAVFFMG